jgi:Rrf2 family protein
MKLNRKLEYALMALKYLDSKGGEELATAKEMSARFGAPFDVISRVLQILASRGILKSEQGAHGGYLVSGRLEDVSFFELAEMILGPMGMVRCLHKPLGRCDLTDKCNIVSPVSYLNSRLMEFYKGLTVKEIIRGNEQQNMAPQSRLGEGVLS